ncbi:MAG: Asp23/Gls24 family envelope stress response protein [Deltaproteobacteria bacterium]|nr:Asp23/Gls24 family envelope stress response protein [Deltaproteobacteria bacterium]
MEPKSTHPQTTQARAASPQGATTEQPIRTRGKTYVEDEVVSVIARIAAEEVPGVHKIGGSNLRQIMSRFGRHHGVDAEVGMEEAAVDVEIVVDFGHPIRDVAEEMRERVILAVESMTGRRVVEVNIFVVDVHVAKTESRSRRQLE